MATITAEVGTTGEYATIELGEMRADLAEAIEHEHPCEDPGCDITHALASGYVLASAALLTGATETPLLDAVVSHYLSSPTGAVLADALAYRGDEWDQWAAWHRATGVQCPACEGYTYADAPDERDDVTTCAHCGADLTPSDRFDAPATPDTVVWIAGHNLTGYLPESTPSYCLTAVHALECLRSDLDSLADHYAMGPDGDDDPSRGHYGDTIAAMDDIEAVLARFTDPGLREEAAADYVTSGGADFSIEHSHYWVERRTLGEVVDAGDDRSTMFGVATVDEVLDYLNEAC